jgi:hypothetical protein
VSRAVQPRSPSRGTRPRSTHWLRFVSTGMGGWRSYPQDLRTVGLLVPLANAVGRRRSNLALEIEAQHRRPREVELPTRRWTRFPSSRNRSHWRKGRGEALRRRRTPLVPQALSPHAVTRATADRLRRVARSCNRNRGSHRTNEVGVSRELGAVMRHGPLPHNPLPCRDQVQSLWHQCNRA